MHPSLQEDLLRDLRETGMYEFAQNAGVLSAVLKQDEGLLHRKLDPCHGAACDVVPATARDQQQLFLQRPIQQGHPQELNAPPQALQPQADQQQHPHQPADLQGGLRPASAEQALPSAGQHHQQQIQQHGQQLHQQSQQQQEQQHRQQQAVSLQAVLMKPEPEVSAGMHGLLDMHTVVAQPPGSDAVRPTVATCGEARNLVDGQQQLAALPVNADAEAAAQAAMAALEVAQHCVRDLCMEAPASMETRAAAQIHAMCGQEPPAVENDAGAGAHDAGSLGARRRRTTSRAVAQLDQGGTCASGALGAGARERGDTGSSGGKAKGLRHFSLKVCEKVESKGTTTYNEVADELVAEMRTASEEEGGLAGYDEKNIRRRVYDAINVLMALDIIAKERKAILWRGLPRGCAAGGAACGAGSGGGATTDRGAAHSDVVTRLAQQHNEKLQEVRRKSLVLEELVAQQRALRSLLERNAARASSAPTGTVLVPPFVLVAARSDATVEVQISDDMRDVQFDFFNSPFQMHDDTYILRMLEAASVQAGEGAPAANGIVPSHTLGAELAGGTGGSAGSGPATAATQLPHQGAQFEPAM